MWPCIPSFTAGDAGCITLVMACLLTSAWLRSFSEYYQRWFRKFDEATSCSVSLWNDDIRIQIRMDENLSVVREWSIAIPYWFAIPLTLLSAYLLLWEPRKRASSNA
jgi:hypothetical protein